MISSKSIGIMSRYWDFKIEQKTFVLHLSSDGGSVIISESTRLASFEMTIDVAVAMWMKKMLDEALVMEAIG